LLPFALPVELFTAWPDLEDDDDATGVKFNSLTIALALALQTFANADVSILTPKLPISFIFVLLIELFKTVLLLFF
jgi:hypothetical protein